MPKPRLILIDGSGYFYRAFFAIKYLTNSKGFPTNAVYGFTRMLLKIINQQQPEYLGIAFDTKAPTFRHRQFADYKAHRPPMPDSLSRQIPYIKQVVEAFNIPRLELDGYEADDVIGTIARQAGQQGIETLIVSGDKDMWQLVNQDTQVFDELRGKTYDQAEVEASLGVEPGRMIEVMALAGDSSDNIPGVPGIGMKTAVKLIQEFGSLEKLLDNLPQVGRKMWRENLRHYAQQAHLSRQLVAIDTQTPLGIDWGQLRFSPPDYRKTARLFKELEFFSLLEQLSTDSLAQPEVKTEVILSQEQLQKLLQQLRSAPRFAFALHITPRQPMLGELVGVSLACQTGQGYYLPLGHDYAGAPAQLEKTRVLKQLKPLWEDSAIKKSVPDIKFTHLVLARQGISARGIDFDPILASYLLNSGKHKHSLPEIALEHLNRKLNSYEELAGKGSKEVAFKQLPLPEAGRYGAEACSAVYQLREKMLPQLEQEGLSKLFREMEIPLGGVLAQMELSGIRLDVKLLEDMSRRLERELSALTERIHFLAGEQFNADSPKQLAYILFERLGLPTLKRIKTGYSTNLEVLQELALFHPLPVEVLEYRKLKKLKSTYVDSLPSLLNPQTGRLHTSLNQTVTATGRLSSSQPNLQNIPIRGELGSRIRQAFIPAEGCQLVSADYSQIELRLMAHLAKDENLLAAFARGEDIHQRTAMEVFRLRPGQVTPEMRRRAKAINFGILYGMSAYGLAKEIKLGPREAQQYIESYFARYPQVKAFIQQTIDRAGQEGYTSTLFGRRRYLPELQAKDKQTRQFGERMAVNAPIQGSAADIIKLAMIALQQEFKRHKVSSRLLLQVHDELLFEVPEGELKTASQLIKEEMEGVVELLVPLQVQIKAGASWAEVK